MKVSIIIPCYNVSSYVLKPIESIKKAMNGKVEIEAIVVNDCSTDDTLDLIKKNIDSRFKLLDLSENKGVSGARNEGIKVATGEYVFFLDGDDELNDNFQDVMQKLGKTKALFARLNGKKGFISIKSHFKESVQPSTYIISKKIFERYNPQFIERTLFEDNHFIATIESILLKENIKEIQCFERVFTYTNGRVGSTMNSKHGLQTIQKSFDNLEKIDLDERVRQIYLFQLWYSFLYNLKTKRLISSTSEKDVKKYLEDIAKRKYWSLSKLPILYKLRWMLFKITKNATI